VLPAGCKPVGDIKNVLVGSTPNPVLTPADSRSLAPSHLAWLLSEYITRRAETHSRMINK
jgi:hypothetical protein